MSRFVASLQFERSQKDDTKLKSAVIRKASQASDGDSDQDLDFDTELKLVKQAQHLRQQLSLIDQEQDEEQDEKSNITIERQVKIVKCVAERQAKIAKNLIGVGCVVYLVRGVEVYK